MPVVRVAVRADLGAVLPFMAGLGAGLAEGTGLEPVMVPVGGRDEWPQRVARFAADLGIRATAGVQGAAVAAAEGDWLVVNDWAAYVAGAKSLPDGPTGQIVFVHSALNDLLPERDRLLLLTRRPVTRVTLSPGSDFGRTSARSEIGRHLELAELATDPFPWLRHRVHAARRRKVLLYSTKGDATLVASSLRGPVTVRRIGDGAHAPAVSAGVRWADLALVSGTMEHTRTAIITGISAETETVLIGPEPHLGGAPVSRIGLGNPTWALTQGEALAALDDSRDAARLAASRRTLVSLYGAEARRIGSAIAAQEAA